MAIDIHFIRRKIKLIQEDLSELDSLAHYSFDEISKDHIKYLAVERLLEKIIMRAIDINHHMIAELGRGDEQVRGYEDTFSSSPNWEFMVRNSLDKLLPVLV